MGIDVQIKEFIKSGWSKKSFISKQKAQEQIGEGFVKIQDCLTSLFHIKGPRFSGLFKTSELYEVFVKPIRKAFKEDNARVYVAILDDEVNKSIRKARTHARRAKASKTKNIKPYESTISLVQEGIYDSDSGQTTLFDIERLAITKSLRPALWALFLTWLKTESFLELGEHLLIFEYASGTSEAAGPVFLPSLEAWPAEVQKPDNFYHDHSEGDPSCAYWANIFKNKNCIVMSVDGDLIPIFFQLIGSMKDTKQNSLLYWFFNESAEHVVDVKTMTKDVTSATGLTHEQFVLYCIVCDTDYVDKSMWAQGFGCLPILYTLKQMKKELQHILDICGNIAYTKEIVDEEAVEKAMIPFKRIVQKLYENGRKKEFNQAMMALKPMVYQVPKVSGKKAKTTEEGDYVVTQEDENETPVRKDKKTEAPGSHSSKNELYDHAETSEDDMNVEQQDKYKYTTRLMSFETIKTKYGNMKSYKVPDEDTIKQVTDEVMWNYIFWRQQTVREFNA